LYGFVGNSGVGRLDFLGAFEVDPDVLDDEDNGPNTWGYELLVWSLWWECESAVEACCDGKNWEVHKVTGKARGTRFLSHKYGWWSPPLGGFGDPHDSPSGELLVPFMVDLTPLEKLDLHLLVRKLYIDAWNSTIDNVEIARKSLAWRHCYLAPRKRIKCRGQWMKTGVLPVDHGKPIDSPYVTLGSGELDAHDNLLGWNIPF
jgi:hypothetical protein